MATLTPEYRHEPVMLQEVLEALRLSEGSTVCDCTLGGAGHSVKMAAQVGEEGLLIGIDQDDIGTPSLKLGLQRGHLGVPGDFAVHIIGVQDDGFAGQILLHRVCPGRGYHQRQRHDYRQKQC